MELFMGIRKLIVAISPVFDEGDIREGLGGGCGHMAMIPSMWIEKSRPVSSEMSLFCMNS